jgi:hypothetical protein
MGPWSVNPAWQNFSSLHREAWAAGEAQTGFEKAHHLTAALYFGISAIEAFLNREMRAHLSSTRSEEDVFKLLRNSRFLNKLEAWPKEITGNEFPLQKDELDIILLANEVRGDLTHPKTLGHDIYERLFQLEPPKVVDAIAKYIVAFNQARQSRFPYWIFGWNYLNPRPNTYDIILINDQQFCHSLAAIGFNVPSYDWAGSERWRDNYLSSIDGYISIRDALDQVQHCEPKFDRFPFQPKLCRRWWLPEHQVSCGNVTPESIKATQDNGEA